MVGRISVDEWFKIKRDFGNYAILYFKGFCMGIADIIPGISGGTIAFIFNIYEELIEAIRSFNLDFAKRLIRLQIREAFAHTDWPFLAVLVSGILTAIFSLSKIISWLLSEHPVLIQSFFFGLIVATVPIIGRHVRQWNAAMVAWLVAAASASYFLVGLIPINTPETAWFVFLSGMIAICAMILPGISGAFILVLLGKYSFIIEAVKERNIGILMIVASGTVVGLLTFVRVLSWLFRHFHNITLAVLTGFVLGSLRKVWPWKIDLEVLEVHGKIVPIKQMNILPNELSVAVLLAGGLMIIGFTLAMGLDRSPKGKGIELS